MSTEHSSTLRQLPLLDEIEAQTIYRLRKMSPHDLMRAGGVAVQDLAIQNPIEWAGGTEPLTRRIHEQLFTDEGELQADIRVVLWHLRRVALTKHDPEALAVALCRFAGECAFAHEAWKRLLDETRENQPDPSREPDLPATV